jgi:hypothetical protein
MKCGLSFASRKLSPLVASAKPESERATTVACEKSHKSFWEGTASAVPTGDLSRKTPPTRLADLTSLRVATKEDIFPSLSERPFFPKGNGDSDIHQFGFEGAGQVHAGSL